MQKDYYHILQVSPAATVEEIRAAFRKLAHKYHPDKQDSDANASLFFTEVYEAYHVLTDPVLSREYRLRRQQAGGKNETRSLPATAKEMLALSAALRDKIVRADPFRVDRDLMQYEILYLLSDRNQQILQLSGDLQTIDQFIQNITQTGHLLTYASVKQIAAVLRKIARSGSVSDQYIDSFVNNARRNFYWNKYKTTVALLIALTICLLIYLST